MVFNLAAIQTKAQHSNSDKDKLITEIEKSLFNDLINKWYPLNIDTVNGGFISELNHDWSISKSSQVKSLVQQSRHVWSTAFIYEAYPDKKQFLGYSKHGFKFLKEKMWDKEFGGFVSTCQKDGAPDQSTINKKEIYGQSFAIYGLSQYYKVSKDPEALDLAKKAFLWVEKHAHDKKYGGYFQHLKREGGPFKNIDGFPGARLKDFNSTIHIMEGFTQLYKVWPDSLVRLRLEEMFYIIRDTFTHPDGYLKLYFHEDWKPVDYDKFKGANEYSPFFNEHFTYGHDVETAYLLLETAEALGIENDEKTMKITKRLVDHSLESGWDTEKGGFYDGGHVKNGKIEIFDKKKSWWGQAEGLNALSLMHKLYPDDKNDYYGKFVKMWDYITTYLIDAEHGGWYNYGIDTCPPFTKKVNKSYVWKTTYHNARALVHCIHRAE